MGWLGFGNSKSHGSGGKSSNVKMNVKFNKSGKATDVLVSRSGSNPHKNHTHYVLKKGSAIAKQKGKG